MRPGIALALLIAAAAVPAGAQTVPGYAVTVFSTLPDPTGLDFDAAGNLVVGRDVLGPVADHFVRKVPPAGGAPADYGPFALPDPGGVWVDATHRFAAEDGAVVVSGSVSGTSGQIVAILPSDEDPQPGAMVQTLHAAASGGAVAPLYMDEGAGGLLILDPAQKAILQLTPAPALALAPLFTHAETPRFLAVDPATGEIFVSYDTAIRRYDPAGGVVDGSFVTGLVGPLPIAFSPGGDFPAGLYAIEAGAGPATGRLLHVAMDGTFAEVGTGFPANLGEIEFDAEGALYVASFAAGQVLRVGLPEPPPPPADLGAFVCYNAKPAEPWVKQVQTVADVFGPVDVRVGKPKLLCNPADVSGGLLTMPVPNDDEDTRLAGHLVKTVPRSPLAAQALTVTNAIGTWSITTAKGDGDRMLVPSSVAAGVPPPLPASSAVDSFRCYKARVDSGSVETKFDVAVADQVGTVPIVRDLTVKKLKRVCFPAEIQGLDPVGRPDDLLTCYKVKRAKGQPTTPVAAGLHAGNVLDADYLVDTVSGSRTTTSSGTRTARVAGDEIETFVDEGRTRPGEWDLTDSEGPRWAGGGPLSEDAESLKVTFSGDLGLGDDVVRRWRIFVEIDIAVNDTNAGPGVVMRASGIPGIPDGTEARAMAHGKPAGLRVSSPFFTPPSGTTLSALVDGGGEAVPELVFEANGDDSAGAFAFQIKRFGVEYEAVVASQTVRTGVPESELCLPSQIGP